MTNEQKSKYNAFWQHSYNERAVLHIAVPSPLAHMKQPDDPAKRWEDIDYRIESSRHYIKNTKYFAEGIPNAWVNIGPGVLAAMLGSGFTYYPGTVWFGLNPVLKDWSGMEAVHLSHDNYMFKLVTEMTRRLCEDSGGDYTIGITDLGGNLDILASLRGTEQLLFDLIEEPEAVDKAVIKIDDFWEEAFTHFYSQLEAAQKSMMAWFPIWCEKRWYPLQCDFSAMISPDHFERFVLPSLTRCANFLDHSIYHLDGIGELPHVDLLLSIDRLDGIQWTPGDGKPKHSDDCWFPLYEKIQSKGKCLVIIDQWSAQDIIYMLKNLSHKGLFISGTLNSCEEAEEVVRKAAEYAK